MVMRTIEMIKHGRCRVLLVLLLLFASQSMAKLTQALPGEPTDWHGFAKHDFEVDGRACYVVAPKHPAPGNPWVWRARFPGFHSEADVILLGRGFHVAFMNTNGMFGSDAALDHWDKFYDRLTQAYGFSDRPALEGVSRGGLFVYRWAARHPERVACIYADTPVCDFKSWPGGIGSGTGSKKDWQHLLKQYGLTQEQALAYENNPIDVLSPIAKAGVPLLHIVSLNDQVVPPKTNTFVLAHRYRKLGGRIDIIEVPKGTKKSKGHHFKHPDPLRVADFIERYASVTPDEKDYFILRGSLDNCRLRFEREKKGKVVFLGGSITNMSHGWREMTAAYLKQRFPETEFTFINAGIGSTGSVYGSFRLDRDAFAGGAPDLLFEEAAVNDHAIGLSNKQIRRGMEGVVRGVRQRSPMTEVVMMHFAAPYHSADYRAGKTPRVTAIHEPIAEHYGLPTIHLHREVSERIDEGQFNWKKDFKNLHPSPMGHRLYASTIRRALSAAWESPIDQGAAQARHALPEAMDEFAYDHVELVLPKEVTQLNGFKLIEKCDPSANGVGGRLRSGYHGIPMLVGDTPGDGFSLTFQGRGVSLLAVAGKDAGVIAYRIDGGDWQTKDIKKHFPGIHLPRVYVLADELDPTVEHTLELRLTDERADGACRIAYLAVNGK